MNAPAQFQAVLADSFQAPEQARLREIPYNYTSFSDREIVIRTNPDDVVDGKLSPAIRATVVHELVHALQDQRSVWCACANAPRTPATTKP